MIKNDEIKWKDSTVQYQDDDGSILTFPCRVQIIYYVYVLVLNGDPVYVGCTTDIDNRIIAHKKTKIFDGYKIVFQNPIKSKSYNFEITSIELLKALGYNINYNKQKKIIASRTIIVSQKKKSRTNV